MDGFHASNAKISERIKRTAAAGSFSNEYQQMRDSHIKKMHVQAHEIAKSLESKQRSVKSETDRRKKSIKVREFASIPQNRSHFESFSKVIAEAKVRLDTLLFRNKQDENEIQSIAQYLSQRK